jgi:type II secretory pathway pseudopilin PulG
VIAIISVLLGLLLPAVQSARIRGRRSDCANKLRMLALAVRSYEQRYNRFPPSHTVEPEPLRGLIPQILDGIENIGLRDAYNFDASWNHESNAKAIAVDIPQLVCSETPEERSQVTDYVPAPSVSSTLYEPLLAKNLIDKQRQWWSMLQPQMRLVNSASVKDGMSHSFMLFEAAGRPAMYKEGQRINGTHGGAHWASDGSSTSVRRFCKDTQLANCENIQGIYSFHPDGCNYAFGDAAVRYIELTISPRVWISMFTMAGELY